MVTIRILAGSMTIVGIHNGQKRCAKFKINYKKVKQSCQKKTVGHYVTYNAKTEPNQTREEKNTNREGYSNNITT